MAPMTNDQWQQYVTSRLDGIQEEVTEARIDIATLETKAKSWGSITGGIWGLIAGSIPSIVMYLVSK